MHAFDRRTDRRTEFSSLDRVCIPCSSAIIKVALYLRSITRECVHIVTRGHSRSPNKDGGHTIRSAIAEDPRYMETMYLLEIEVLHCGNRDFRLFCSCDIDLDPMTFMHERDPYSLEVHRMCKYELFNVKAFESYRLTNIHTYIHDRS